MQSPLLAIQALAARRCAMLIYALALAAEPVRTTDFDPTPLTELHQRDIGCVAVIGIIAHEQREGTAALNDFPDVRETGKRWAGIVGDTVTFETGQPREVVAFAIQQAVQAEQAKAGKAAVPAAYVKERFAECSASMDFQRAIDDAAEMVKASMKQEMPVAAEPDWNTDDPEQIALYREQLVGDLTNPQRIRFCDGMLSVTYSEIAGREGAESTDAKAFGRLAKALSIKAASLPKQDKLEKGELDKILAMAKTEEDREAMIGRCIRLAESLALAMPPEP
jgi:hypothetical protein